MWMIRMLKTVLCLLCLLIVLPSGAAFAGLPYKTLYYDANLKGLSIQPLYVPDGILEYPMEEPVHLFVASNDHVFVVDKAKNRVIQFDEKRSFIRAIGDEEGSGKLNSPEGVFVAPDGTIYVADSGNERIAVYAAEGKYVRAYGKPESPVLTGDYYFIPSKLVVDSRGVMYIAVKGSDQGILRMSPEGKFLGFFGANKANPSFMNWIKKLILTKQQMAKEVANKPRAIENVAQTPSGYILSVSPGLWTTGNIRKLNASGIDSLNYKTIYNSWNIVDATADRNDFLYGIDQETGKISLYDPKGNILFDFGGKQQNAQMSGRFAYPTSIAITSRFDILVADSGMKVVQFFKRTEFADLALTAADLYYKGRYEESRSYWEKLAVQNEMFDLTYQGLGRVGLQDDNYEQSLDLFKEAYDVGGYSEAFWYVRNDRIQAWLAPLLLAVLIGFIIFRMLRSKVKALVGSVKWPASIRRYGLELRDFFYVILHPYEGYYRLKDRKISFVVLFFVLILVCAAKAAQIYGSGFIFRPYDLKKINLLNELLIFMAPWITWVAANYLVCGVKGGEGRFREVLQSSAFGLAPYVAFSAIIIPLSNIVVLEESILVTAVSHMMFYWTIFQFFTMTQVIHNFDFLETVKNTAITVVTGLIIWFFFIIIAGLSFNLYDFIYQLYREVTYYA